MKLSTEINDHPMIYKHDGDNQAKMTSKKHHNNFGIQK